MGFKLEGDLITNIDHFDEHVMRGMVAGANYVAPQAEAYMKDNAPWTDRTGAARNGLRSKVVVQQSSVAIVLYHTVPYGIWLEVRWGGKYQIIRPTMQYFAPKLVEAVGRLIFK